MAKGQVLGFVNIICRDAMHGVSTNYIQYEDRHFFIFISYFFHMEKFQDKYRIASARLQSWDYGSQAAYFVTICTKHRTHFFGEIIDNQMQLNSIGELAETEWLKTPEIRPDMNLELGEFVIMPNHFHAILNIGQNQYNIQGGGNFTTANAFGPQSKNLASVIRGFKSAVTTQARIMGYDNFEWQSRFHDHIIRDESSFERIETYIRNNPANWKDDRFYSL